LPKPVFSYYGGKAGLARTIAALLPPHDVYIEPFFGSGAVLFAKAPALHEIANDLDGAVVNFFRVLRDRREDLELACVLTPHAREEYAAADLEAQVDDLERARRFWCRVNQSFAKTAGKATGWSITTGRTQSVPASIASRIGRFAGAVERLRGISFECCDAAALVARFDGPEVCWYVDPPYLGSTRSTPRATGRGDYRVDMLGEGAHRELATALSGAAGGVLVSGYNSELYQELYAAWFRQEIEVTTHSSNVAGAGTRRNARRVEVLWSNRPLRSPAPLFEAPAPATSEAVTHA